MLQPHGVADDLGRGDGDAVSLSRQWLLGGSGAPNFWIWWLR